MKIDLGEVIMDKISISFKVLINSQCVPRNRCNMAWPCSGQHFINVSEQSSDYI